MIGAIFSTALAAKSRPNILFMLGDDWGWGDVGAYNGGVNASFALTGTGSRTPTLDALAANGTLFTDFHVGQAYCAPSRASFMSGRWPADLSINTNWNVGPTGAAPNLAAGNPYQLPLPSGKGMSPYPGGLPNVAYTMQQAGYRTAHYGKWHLGGLNPNATSSPVPTDYGFDDSSTYGSPVMAFPGLADEHNRLIGREEGADPHWWSADVGDDIRDSGIRFMKEAVGNSTPFYLHLWWHMSHDTIDPRPEQLVDFPFNTTCNFPSKELGQTTCPSQIFWGAQTWSDKHRFGPVIRAVDELGIRDNTYIIFSTDNGAQVRACELIPAFILSSSRALVSLPASLSPCLFLSLCRATNTAAGKLARATRSATRSGRKASSAARKRRCMKAAIASLSSSQVLASPKDASTIQ